jgi:tetratricopeptide (TPR) repeat protein
MSETWVSTDTAIGIGIKLFTEGQKGEAEKIFLAALESDPGSFAAKFWLGHCAFERKANYEALYWFDRALKINRKSAVAHANRGMVLSELGHNDEAGSELRTALAIDPKSHIAKVNLANTLVRLGRFKEAITMATEALEINPHDDIAYFNRGIAKYSLDDVAGAIADYDRSLHENPKNAESSYNLANALLKVGQLREGFQRYDARLSTTQAGNYYYFEPTAPWWKGEDLAGKTILIHGEQGIGDSIMFMRYVEVIAEQYRTAKIVVVPHTALLSMCHDDNRYPHVVIHPAAEKPYPQHDYYTYLMSLPGIVGTDLDSIPRRWHPEDEWSFSADCRTWGGRAKSLVVPDDTNIGICWSGNVIHKNDAHRSMALEQFAPIVRSNPDVQFHCIQKEIRPCDLALVKELGIKTYCDHLTDMRETAHLIGCLDMVISVDTAVAHLAATFGKPTWILLPKFRTDWRWMMSGDRSPWYPSARLFRQFSVGDWLPVTTWVAKALSDQKRVAA